MASASGTPSGWMAHGSNRPEHRPLDADELQEMGQLARNAKDPKVRAAMQALLQAEKTGDAMAASSASAKFLLDELREDGPFWPAKNAAVAAFKAGQWQKALVHYSDCLGQLKRSPVPMQRPTDGGAAQKALGAEMAKLNANISMLYLKLGRPEHAVVAAADAISNFSGWPKAHARHAEALSAAGRHHAAALAPHPAAPPREGCCAAVRHGQ